MVLVPAIAHQAVVGIQVVEAMELLLEAVVEVLITQVRIQPIFQEQI